MVRSLMLNTHPYIKYSNYRVLVVYIYTYVYIYIYNEHDPMISRYLMVGLIAAFLGKATLCKTIQTPFLQNLMSYFGSENDIRI